MDMLGFNPFEGESSSGISQAAYNDEIGQLLDITGSTATVRFDSRQLRALSGHPDATIASSGRIGSHIKLRMGNRWLLAAVRNLRLDHSDGDLIVATIDFLGEGDIHSLTGMLRNFHRGVTSYPMPGTAILPVSQVDLGQMFAATERAHIEIGTVHPTEDIRAALFIDALLGKHFALLGSTGTGKSTATALILHRICKIAPQGHVVMMDPHGEYGAAFADTGEIFTVDNIAMPYWLMNFEEHCEVLLCSEGADRSIDADILAKCLMIARAKSRAAQGVSKLTVDSPIPYMLSDLVAAVQTEMGRLDRAGEVAPYMRLKTKLDELRNDPRYAFMFSGVLVGDSMAAFMAKLLRMPGNGKPISIVDLSGVPSDVVQVVVAVISRMIFDYAVWARNEAKHPILLVCEEAHRYVPSDRTTTGASVRKILERIAKEGRKYGVSLGLVTQRPSDLAEGVLSQCGTIIAMRLNNERDQLYVKHAMPEGAHGFLEAIPALRNRECVICGEGVAIPLRVHLDELEADKRPASDDPIFSTLWQQTGDETEILTRTIKRWRNQRR